MDFLTVDNSKRDTSAARIKFFLSGSSIFVRFYIVDGHRYTSFFKKIDGLFTVGTPGCGV